MNRQEFEDKYLLAITPRQRPVLNGFLQGDSDRKIATALHTTDSNIRQHIRNICQVFEIGNLPGESERYRKDLIDLFLQYKPELVADRWKNVVTTRSPVSYPSGAVPLDSSLYIDRESIETDIKRYITESRALIRILAPSKFGKTSLCFRIKSHAISQGYRSIYINLKQSFDRNNTSEFELFLQHFCKLINEELDLCLNDDWDSNYAPSRNFNRYMETILRQADTPILLILDGVESVYTANAVNQNFFQMLRSWHDKGADPQKQQWQKIRQLIVYSSENYGELDFSRSPFNVGRPYELKEFTESNVVELAIKYGLNWERERVIKLMSLVAGHPYLINLALYHFGADRSLTLEKFLNTNEIQDHLRSLTSYFARDSELKLALKKAIGSDRIGSDRIGSDRIGSDRIGSKE